MAGGTSVGLASGIDYGQLINDLIELEQKPIAKLEEKISLNEIKQEAYTELMTQSLGVKLSMFDLATQSTFEKKLAESSNDSILSASATSAATVGTHTFQVARLAAASVNVSNGFSDQDASTVGSGSLTFELGGRRLDQSVDLDVLNNGAGVMRGLLTLTDSGGGTETIDLSSAVTFQDALDLLNSNGMSLQFSTDRTVGSVSSGYALNVENTASSGAVTISQAGSSKVLEDMGLSTSGSLSVSHSSTQAGSQIHYLSEASSLALINDGFGINTSGVGESDLRFYVQSTAGRKSVDVDLHGSEDVGDVLNAINGALFDAGVHHQSQASLSSDGVSIEFTGTVSGFSNLNGSRAATDLGLNKIKLDGTVYKGEALLAEMGSSLIRNLHGGHGIDGLETGVFTVQSRQGEHYHINLENAVSVSDIVSIITDTDGELGSSNKFLRAEINAAGNGIVIKDDSTGNGTLRIDDKSGTVAKQLGLSTSWDVQPVMVNPLGSTTSGRSVVYLSKNSLPQGLTENDMVGKSLEHRWSSRANAENALAPSNDLQGTSTGKIIAFEAAPEDIFISAMEATAASTFTLVAAAGKDTLTDNINLDTINRADWDSLIGSTVTVHSSTGPISSTVESYTSTGTGASDTIQSLTFSDDSLTNAGGLTAASLEAVGYSIKFNHKVVLEYEPSVTAIGDVAATLNPTTLVDVDFSTTLAATNYSADDLIGASLTISKAGVDYSGVIDSYDGVNTITFSNDNFSGNVNSADIQSGNYTISFPPFPFGGLTGGAYSGYLSEHSSVNIDQVRVVGVASNEDVVGGNLENRMISGATRLDDLNGGNGINRGKFEISNGTTTAEIDLTQTALQTVQDLLDEISGEIPNVAAEINDRGDGIRIYDLFNTGTLSIVDSEGTAAADLNIAVSTLSQKTLSGTQADDFYSLIGTLSNSSYPGTGRNITIEVNGFDGLDKDEVVGSYVSYVDDSGTANVNGRTIKALVIDYNSKAGGVGELVIASPVIETEASGGGGIHDMIAAGQTAVVAADTSEPGTILTTVPDAIKLHLKEHFSSFEGKFDIANPTDNGDVNDGIFTIDIASSQLTNYSEEQLIGSFLRFHDDDVTGLKSHAFGAKAMITDFSVAGATTTLTLQSSDMDHADLNGITTPYVSISTIVQPDHHIQVGNFKTDGSLLFNLEPQGYTSLSAELSSSVTTDGDEFVFTSDQFANLSRQDVVGSLLNIKDGTSSTHEGYIAVVTDYDEVNRTIKTTDFYNSLGTKVDTSDASNPSTTLAAGDDIVLTFARELEGAVIRATDKASDTGTSTPQAWETKRIIDLSGVAGLGDYEALGATISFTSGTNSNQSRTIVDIIHDFNGVAGTTAFVLDEDLLAIPGASDNYTISYDNIKATIDHIDFQTGVVTTREELTGGFGGRDFSIHAVSDGSYQKEMKVLEGDTLDDVASRINNLNAGVTASVINDGSGASPYRLSVIADRLGKSGAVNIASKVTGFDFDLTTRGEDAKVIMGAGSGSSSIITSSTNTVTEAISGVTLNLHQSSGESVSLSVTNDIDGLVEKTTTIIDEINTLLKSAGDLTAFEVDVEIEDDDGNVRTEKQKGILFGDYTTRTMITQIKGLLTTLVEGLPTGHLNAWSDIGIELDSTGNQFEFDDSLMQSMLQSKFDQVKALFTTNPNLGTGASVSVSNNFLQANYNINDVRNGNTSSSGYSESGNGSNGGKFVVGDKSKYLTYTFGENKRLYGFRLHHHVPDDLTARKTVAASDASSASISPDGLTFTDTTNLTGLVSDQLIGSILTLGAFQAEITGYDSAGALTLNTSITGATPSTDGYALTTKSGENISFSHNAVLEYRDPATGSYKEYRTFGKMGDGKFTHVFFGGLETDSLRLRYNDNSGDSEDFSLTGTNYARILEFEALDSQGIGSEFNKVFSGFTDATTGSISIAEQALQDVNETYSQQATRMLNSISAKQERLIKDFSTLEQTISKLNSQNNFLQSSLGSLPTAFSYRGNNK
jgi:flagellar hook-associated protein 2